MLPNLQTSLMRRKRIVFDWLLFTLALGAMVVVMVSTLAVRPGLYSMAEGRHGNLSAPSRSHNQSADTNTMHPPT